MYNVDYNYRDQDHPYTFVFLPQTQGMMPQPMVGPGTQPWMTPYAPTTPMAPYAPTTPMAPPASVVNPPIPSGSQLLPMATDTAIAGAAGGGGAAEESYIENILRFNRGKIATIYMTFENNNQWNARVFRGRVETAGRDHIIVSDPQTGKRYVLLMINLDWIEFDGPVAYIPPTTPPGILTEGPGVGPSSPRDEE